jgi:putative hydrolase of the HAD superfamily
MPLLLLDLDNTLIDREAAYRRWAATYAARLGRPPTEADWLVAMDRDGYEKRERLAELICLRYGLGSDRQADVVDELRRGLIEHLEPDAAVPAAIDQARAAGWIPVVVTHGNVAQQERKLHRAGLALHVAGWVISEGVGVRKPDPKIFQLAAAKVGQELVGAWMIGDSAEHDIGGAHKAGLPSVWLHRGRTWELPKYAPTFIADNFAGAIEAVLTEPHPTVG